MENNFDREKFSNILNEIYKIYPNQRNFANAMGTSRGYLSQYINQKLKNPPTPKILEKIALNSHGLTTYDELMTICGYIDTMQHINNSLSHPSEFFTVPIFININGNLKMLKNDEVVLPKSLDNSFTYFGYKCNNDDMQPLLGINDIAIVQKTNIYKNGKIYLISLDKDILVRRIMDFKDYIELHTLFPIIKPIKILNEEKEKRNFEVLGKVIKSENESAFD